MNCRPCRYAAITQLTYRQVVGAAALVWMPSKQTAWCVVAVVVVLVVEEEEEGLTTMMMMILMMMMMTMTISGEQL